MLACWECKNLEAFLQTSGTGDARTVMQTPQGIRSSAWEVPDGRTPGLWCANCGGGVEADLGALGLDDVRISFVAPQDFDAEALTSELMGLRPDASWSRLDLPARPPRFAPMPSGLHPSLVDALDRTARSQLFTHQAEAIERALEGQSVIQATAAGSGKSIGLLFPVLDRLLRDPSATAIVLYPLRALANDQLNALQRLGLDDGWIEPGWALDLRLSPDPDCSPIRIARLDGATPDYLRKPARAEARLLITTPDSVHASMLRMATRQYKDGTSWRPLLRGLSHIVLDEVHAYQGVFGSAVGNVLRRLRRAAAWYGANPRVLAASATIGNPVAHAERLTGAAPFTLVDDDGSPRRRRILLICNPPFASDAAQKKHQTTKGIDDVDGRRLAPMTMALDLVPEGALASETHEPIRTICFARSRNQVFGLKQRLQAKLTEMQRKDLINAVASYAATFVQDDRQEEEGRLRDGSTLAVVSTSALELGIDIPDLSLAVLVGYPGQLSSFRQRSGRVGRAGEGLVVLIVGDDPLQQHLATHPEELEALLHARAEDVIVNPEAPEIVRRYGLRPAQLDVGGVAFEDAQWFGEPAVEEWLADVTGPPVVEHKGTAYWARPEVSAEENVYDNLRSTASGEPFTVVTRGERQVIGTIDAATAPRDCFVPAIWHGPKATYRVIGFDVHKREIYCEGPGAYDHSTRGIGRDTILGTAELDPPRSVGGGAAQASYTTMQITRHVHS